MTETPRDPFAPDPEPTDAETPPAPGAPVEESASPYAGAGEPEVVPPAPEPAEASEPDPTPTEEPAEAPAPQPVEVPQPAEVPQPVEVPTPVDPVAPAATVPPSYPVPAAASAPEPAPEPSPEPAPEPVSAPEPVPASAPRRAWLPVTAVALAVLLLAGATGWLGWQVRQESVAEAGRPDAVAAARDAARLLFSYSHESLEEDFAAGLAVTTGEFRSEYSRTTKEVVTPVAEQYDAVVVAEVVEAAIIDAGPGRATALVFLNQGTTSTRVKGQQVDQSRVRMQLVERDGRWLVRAVDAL